MTTRTRRGDAAARTGTAVADVLILPYGTPAIAAAATISAPPRLSGFPTARSNRDTVLALPPPHAHALKDVASVYDVMRLHGTPITVLGPTPLASGR